VVLEVLSQADKMKLAWITFYDSDLVKMLENFVFIQYLSEMMENGTTENGNKPKDVGKFMLHSNFLCRITSRHFHEVSLRSY